MTSLFVIHFFFHSKIKQDMIERLFVIYRNAKDPKICCIRNELFMPNVYQS